MYRKPSMYIVHHANPRFVVVQCTAKNCSVTKEYRAQNVKTHKPTHCKLISAATWAEQDGWTHPPHKGWRCPYHSQKRQEQEHE